ncbi:MAG TPA: hypothetical protein VK784_13195 [Pseudonocardiaceae bacterium]|nr:hypothetical protein [Pseudonocardiaceae bacterium]
MSTTHPHHTDTIDPGARVAAQVGARVCAVGECDRPYYGKGLCQAHHRRKLRTGTPGPAEITTRRPRPALCTVEGCDQPHHALGYCPTHYSRWRRTGDVHPATPPNPRGCGVPGCEQRHYARGLCRAHYRRWQKAGGVQPALDMTECAQLYREGASSTSLGRLYGCTPHTILTALRTAGVPIRAPGRHKRTHTPRQPTDQTHEITTINHTNSQHHPKIRTETTTKDQHPRSQTQTKGRDHDTRRLPTST